MNWAIGIDMYTLMCLKLMTNKNLLCKKINKMKKIQFVLCTVAHSYARVCKDGEINHPESQSVCELSVSCISRESIPLSSFS